MIGLIVTLMVIGVLLYLFNAYVTMIDGRIKQIINVVVIICVVFYILHAFGILGGADVPVPQVR